MVKCQCGCGTLIEETDKRGRPKRFVMGHIGRLSAINTIRTYKPLVTKICNQCGRRKKIKTGFYSKTYKSKTTGETYKRTRSICIGCDNRNNSQYMHEHKAVYKDRYRPCLTKNIRHWGRISSWRHKTPGCDLTVDFIEQLFKKQESKCYYTGRTMDFYGCVHPNSISLDRLDPKKGYMQDNVVLCCYDINAMKGNRTEQEFYQLMQSILDRQHQIIEDYKSKPLCLKEQKPAQLEVEPQPIANCPSHNQARG